MGLLAAHQAMRGKTAVVVGGAAGYIGRGVTLGLAGEGVNIICCDNDRDGLAAIVPEVAALGVTIDASFADVNDATSLDAFYDHVERLTDSVRSGVAAETAATCADVLPPGTRLSGSVSTLLPTPFQIGLASFESAFGRSRMKAWTL